MLKTTWCCVTGGVKHKDLVLLLESIRYIGHDRESSVPLLRRGPLVCLGDWGEGERSARGKMGRAKRRREAFPSSHHSLRPCYFLIISTFFGILSGRAFAEESGESLITAPQETAPTLSTEAKIFDRWKFTWNKCKYSSQIFLRYFLLSYLSNLHRTTELLSSSHRLWTSGNEGFTESLQVMSSLRRISFSYPMIFKQEPTVCMREKNWKT